LDKSTSNSGASNANSGVLVSLRDALNQGRERPPNFVAKVKEQKMADKRFLRTMLAAALALGMAVIGCVTEGDDGGDDGNVLPVPKGANDLSGKTYIEQEKKIVFSPTAAGAESGTYETSTVKLDDDREYVIVNGKFDYAVTESGYYSWDETAKTVTISPEKVARPEPDGSGYGPLQTKAEGRAEMKELIDEYIKEAGQAAVDAEFASEGFSSVAAYLDYVVAEAFKNVIYYYAFSSDSKALFLDEPLPEPKGANELAGQTYNGMAYHKEYGEKEDGEWVKDPTKEYVFTKDSCTFTETTYDPDNPYTQIYDYAYDNAQKLVYLKVSVATREAAYAARSSNTESGNFANAVEFNAAPVNADYNRMEQYIVNTSDKTLGEPY
jgi:hypothetical protein